jgi:membrane-associated phospholipid phosphatase
MHPLLRQTLLVLTLTTIIVFIGYYWIDQPVVYWSVAHGFNNSTILRAFAHIPDFFFVSIFFMYLFVALRFCLKRTTDLDYKLFVIANILAITDFFRSLLKMVFGRYWPTSWDENFSSLLTDGSYGFNFFHVAGAAYKSFPSGHTACIVAMATILIYFFPRFAWLWCTLVLLTALGLILACYHFFSDVVAGAALGYLIALFTIHISEHLFLGHFHR